MEMRQKPWTHEECVYVGVVMQEEHGYSSMDVCNFTDEEKEFWFKKMNRKILFQRHSHWIVWITIAGWFILT